MKIRTRIVWGILLIVVGVLVALNALGIFEGFMGISLWKILLGTFVLFAIIDGIVKLNFMQSFLMLGVELMLFERYIGGLIGIESENWISNWTVLLIAFLLGAGFDMIFKSIKGRYKSNKFFANVNSFGDHLKYIDCSRFNREYINNRFGDFEIRFENVYAYEGGGVLEIANTFGDVTIFVPSEWEVKVDITSKFGDLYVAPELTTVYADDSARTLYINGTNSFGDVFVYAQK